MKRAIILFCYHMSLCRLEPDRACMRHKPLGAGCFQQAVRILAYVKTSGSAFGHRPGFPLQPRNGMTNRVMPARSTRVRGLRASAAIVALSAVAALTTLAAPRATAKL